MGFCVRLCRSSGRNIVSGHLSQSLRSFVPGFLKNNHSHNFKYNNVYRYDLASDHAKQNKS